MKRRGDLRGDSRDNSDAGGGSGKFVPIRHEPLIFERSRPGLKGFELPPLDVPAAKLPAEFLRGELTGMPEVSESEVVRHFTRISQLNYSIDEGLYPLGSCTMKYNPKINEELARLPGFANLHPLTPAGLMQGALKLLHELERALCEITAMQRFSLQPAAGAHGELTGILMIRKAHTERGNPRRRVLIPDSAHGTNPASAAFAGYQVKELKSNRLGELSVGDLAAAMDEDVAALMLTLPNTLGVFEERIKDIAEIVHAKGGFLYCDGANQNAFMGRARAGDMGVDVMHLNLHKTFATPHGGGGPGSGPVGVGADLMPYLPVPLIDERDGVYGLDTDRPKTIGRTRSFLGNFGMHVRALAYIYAYGGSGLKRVSEAAVLNANYLRSRLKDRYALAYETASLHEVVFSDAKQAPFKVHTLDIAKRLLDYGFHPPTIYFPLIVPGAMMIEPTETEGKEELDAFVAAMLAIAGEAERDPELLRNAPYSTPVRRLDEALAARQPVLRWRP